MTRSIDTYVLIMATRSSPMWTTSWPLLLRSEQHALHLCLLRQARRWPLLPNLRGSLISPVSWVLAPLKTLQEPAWSGGWHDRPVAVAEEIDNEPFGPRRRWLEVGNIGFMYRLKSLCALLRKPKPLFFLWRSAQLGLEVCRESVSTTVFVCSRIGSVYPGGRRLDLV